MKVGILGGRFDPPHIICCPQVWERCKLDEVWFIVAIAATWNNRTILGQEFF